jgi:hypothetical protein
MMLSGTPAMKPSIPTRSTAWIITLLLIAALGLLVVYLPLVAAILFVCLTLLLAIARGAAEGLWKGVIYFIKEILFGW